MQMRRLSLLSVLSALFLLTFNQQPQAQEIVLHSFAGSPDGQAPYSGLVPDGVGNFYGTTVFGGGTGCSEGGCGVVFELSPASGGSWTRTTLHSFTGMPDGQWPYAGLIRDRVGNLYGTTQYGGTYNWGTVYKIDTTGKTSVLYDFKGGADGGEPSGLLVFDKSGNLYGTTVEYPYAYGNVFMLDKKGKETVLYSFTGPPDGAFPQGQLLWDSKGNLYGTTNNGGNQCGFPVISSCGTIYELTPKPTGGWTESVLYRFTGGADGGYPIAGLVQATNGDFYGTTYWGGIPGCDLGFGCGVVFKLDTNLNESVLYSFTGQGDGANTGRSVLLDSAGNFYGTTVYGGPSNSGTVFKISPAGQENVLYAFTGTLDGSNADSNLIQDASGNFYGTAINVEPH